MTKNLSQRIAERLINNKAKKSARNKADFLVHKTDIEQAINDGWSRRLIWETLKSEGKISASYTAFNNYVNKLINNKEGDANNRGEKNKSISTGINGFKYNSNIDTDNLI